MDPPVRFITPRRNRETMPEQAPITNEDPSLETADTTSPSPMAAKIKILLFVTLVIVVECLAAYLYLPSASETAAMAEAALARGSGPQAPFGPGARSPDQA